LPFADAMFDVVACQFGVMFFGSSLFGGGAIHAKVADCGRHLTRSGRAGR